MVRRLISSGSPFEPTIGFSRAVRAGDRILVSGTAPIWPDGSCDPSAFVQALRCFAIIEAALGEAGGGRGDVVRTRTYLTSRGVADEVGRAHGEFFAAVRPAATMGVVAGVLDPRRDGEGEGGALLTL